MKVRREVKRAASLSPVVCSVQSRAPAAQHTHKREVREIRQLRTVMMPQFRSQIHTQTVKGKFWVPGLRFTKRLSATG